MASDAQSWAVASGNDWTNDWQVATRNTGQSKFDKEGSANWAGVGGQQPEQHAQRHSDKNFRAEAVRGQARGSAVQGRRARLDVPACAWGRIIGKGGETLKALQAKYGVTLHVPRPDAREDAAVIVQGHDSDIEAVTLAINALVQDMGRKAKDVRRQQGSNPNSPFPANCLLCSSEINGLVAAFAHLGGARHLSNVKAQLKDIDVPIHASSPAGVAALLGKQELRDLHVSLGFDVDQLIEAASGMEAPQSRQDAVVREASQLTEDFDWLCLEVRWHASWDGTPNVALTRAVDRAPPWTEMLARCGMDERPPVVHRKIVFPARLPNVTRKPQKKRWPEDPTSRFGLVMLLKGGSSGAELGTTSPLCKVDVVCGTSLIYALSGDVKYTKDDFYLQRYGNTLVCLHQSREKAWDANSAGHAVEFLLCGSQGQHKSFYCSSLYRIGGHRVLVTSEVDARSDTGDVVEIKSSAKNIGIGMLNKKSALQLACNGSVEVLCCRLDSQETHLEGMDRFSTSDVLAKHRDSFVYQGQRVRLLLAKICGQLLAGGGSSDNENVTGCTPPGEAAAVAVVGVWRLSFGDGKQPIIEPAPAGIEVLPLGLPSVQGWLSSAGTPIDLFRFTSVAAVVDSSQYVW
eukprot:CAMPEP_0203969880 /NCGR_PEP_ID=MMETSP0359-20131031/97680_1 /ASSEMBLY_ACC=CAM_ASM_000338 /TAXON_ID=268821 /ORGANISM="Scrippsiella Hangoei, Strain SHTV-5" /LENGTH=629 /DNA_ID=CAMNT_0050907823 /DNA_START=55 /DNA_END=1942 /DNA_ORIENTATION=+